MEKSRPPQVEGHNHNKLFFLVTLFRSLLPHPQPEKTSVQAEIKTENTVRSKTCLKNKGEKCEYFGDKCRNCSRYHAAVTFLQQVNRIHRS
jgi:hypothetical protein